MNSLRKIKDKFQIWLARIWPPAGQISRLPWACHSKSAPHLSPGVSVWVTVAGWPDGQISVGVCFSLSWEGAEGGAEGA